jgi:hypothetical protein
VTEIMVSRRDGIVRAPDGTQHRVHRGKTLADAAHPVVQAYPDDWQPMHVELAVEGSRIGMDAEEREALIDELRDDLGHLEAEAVRLAAGLAERGYPSPAEADRRPGWLVDLALAALDERAHVPSPLAAPRAPRAVKPRPVRAAPDGD